MKAFYNKYIGSLYATPYLYVLLIGCIMLFVFRFFLPVLGNIPYFISSAVLLFLVYEYLLLYSTTNGIFAVRSMAERLSNGDENTIRIDLENHYPFTVKLQVIDEIPHQFQKSVVEAVECCYGPSNEICIKLHLRRTLMRLVVIAAVNSQFYCIKKLPKIPHVQVCDASKAELGCIAWPINTNA